MPHRSTANCSQTRVVPGQVGLAGVIAALSVTSDLTRGHPPGEAMRACLLASELACRAGLEPAGQGEVFYTSLMRSAGCAATSHEAAGAFGGDDVAVRSRGDLIDPTRPVGPCASQPGWAMAPTSCG